MNNETAPKDPDSGPQSSENCLDTVEKFGAAVCAICNGAAPFRYRFIPKAFVWCVASSVALPVLPHCHLCRIEFHLSLTGQDGTLFPAPAELERLKRLVGAKKGLVVFEKKTSYSKKHFFFSFHITTVTNLKWLFAFTLTRWRYLGSLATPSKQNGRTRRCLKGIS